MKNVKQMMESNMKEFSIKQQIVIKLIKFLINYIGKDTPNFYSFELDDCFRDEV